MTPGALWLLAGLVCCAAEMVLPGVFLLWIGLAALGTGAATLLLAPSWEGQAAVFALLVVGLVGVVALRMRGRPRAGDLVNAPAAGLVGAACEAIAFTGVEGRVRLGDGSWAARVAGGGAPAPGEPLVVVGLEGTVLLVARQAAAN